jgi:hypothetical protein
MTMLLRAGWWQARYNRTPEPMRRCDLAQLLGLVLASWWILYDLDDLLSTRNYFCRHAIFGGLSVLLVAFASCSLASSMCSPRPGRAVDELSIRGSGRQRDV